MRGYVEHRLLKKYLESRLTILLWIAVKKSDIAKYLIINNKSVIPSGQPSRRGIGSSCRRGEHGVTLVHHDDHHPTVAKHLSSRMSFCSHYPANEFFFFFCVCLAPHPHTSFSSCTSKCFVLHLPFQNPLEPARGLGPPSSLIPSTSSTLFSLLPFLTKNFVI